jgi:hypothetical protein
VLICTGCVFTSRPQFPNTPDADWTGVADDGGIAANDVNIGATSDASAPYLGNDAAESRGDAPVATPGDAGTNFDNCPAHMPPSDASTDAVTDGAAPPDRDGGRTHDGSCEPARDAGVDASPNTAEADGARAMGGAR